MAFASRALTAIEVNGTFYRTQTPATFAAWRAATPEGFVLALKAHRAATQRRDLDEAAPAAARFLESGLTELGSRLGPINWQLMPSAHCEPSRFARFLDRLPPTIGGLPLRHAVEASHPSFAGPAPLALLRERGIARVLVETPDTPAPDTLTANFAYLRLKASALAEPEGYAAAALDGWAARLRTWSASGMSCFVFFIGADKVRAPDAARALLARLSDAPANIREVPQNTSDTG